MMTMVRRAATAMMTKDNDHDEDNDLDEDNNHDDDNGLSGDSERLLLTDSSIQLCFIVLVYIPQVAAKIQKGALKCH